MRGMRRFVLGGLIQGFMVLAVACLCAELFAEGSGRTYGNIVCGAVVGAFAAAMGLVAWHFDLKHNLPDSD